MSLDLLLGPANAGKVERLYDRYLAHLDAGGEALLVVPTGAAVRRAERDLLRRRPALVGGGIVAFDAVFGRVVRNAGDGRRVLGPVERRLRLQRLLEAVPVETLAPSARGPRFVDAFIGLVDRLGGGLVDPDRLAGTASDPGTVELAALYAAWWRRLDEIGAWDLPRMRHEACRRLSRSLEAWDGTRLFVQGFEDLTAAQEALVRGVAARAGATMTLPYEVGRPAFAALRGTVERLADGARIEELRPLAEARSPALEALERRLFDDLPRTPAPAAQAVEAGAPAVELHEVAGARLEGDVAAALVARELRAGTPPERVLIVTPRSPSAYPDLLDALAEVGVTAHAEGRTELHATPFGHALDRLLAVSFDRDGFRREDLYEFLRSPWSGLHRRRVDYAEGRVRSKGVTRGPDALELTVEALERPLLPVDRLRGATDLLAGVAEAVRRMVAAVHTLEARRPDAALRSDLVAARAALETVETLERLTLERPVSADELRAALARTPVSDPDGPSAAIGRVVVGDARAARGADADVVVVLGLESGGFGRGPEEDALLGEVQREALGTGMAGVEVGDLERHRLYTAVTRAARRVVLVRRFATEDGRIVEPSPLLEELERALGAPVPVHRHGLGDVVPELEAAQSRRLRLRALCRLALEDPDTARRLADGDGAARALRRAADAFSRRTTLRDPVVLAELRASDRFSATTLERFADCSSWWFVERYLDPKEIDGQPAVRVLGTVAHAALQRFFRALPATFGRDRLEPGDADRAEALARELGAEAFEQFLSPDTLEARLLRRRLLRDLVAFVRAEAEIASPLAATRLEVSFGGANAAPGLKDGLRIDDFAVTGKIDRIDTDPLFSARGLVQDYKSGRAFSASQIARERRLQIPLYILATRELLGLEPMGGLYRSLSPGNATRGLLDAAQADALPAGLQPGDLLESDDFWGRVDDARTEATAIVGRIRRGDVRHDPPNGSCPSWCPCPTVCRIPRA